MDGIQRLDMDNFWLYHLSLMTTDVSINIQGRESNDVLNTFTDDDFDTENIYFTNWPSRHTQPERGSCITISQDGSWNTASCREDSSFACKRGMELSNHIKYTNCDRSPPVCLNVNLHACLIGLVKWC